MGSSIGGGTHITEEKDVFFDIVASSSEPTGAEQEQDNLIANDKAAGGVFVRDITDVEDPSLSESHRHFCILIDAHVVIERTYMKKKLEIRSVMKRSSRLYEAAQDSEFKSLSSSDKLRLKIEALRQHESQLREINNGSFSDDVTYSCLCKQFVEDCLARIHKSTPSRLN